MSLAVLDRAWDPDSDTNADWFHVEPSSIVLLDGAAPQHPEPVSAFANDAVWLVRRFVELFAQGSTPGRDMSERIESVREQLGREYAALCSRAGFVPVEAPFACLGIAHEVEEQIELLNMGDLSFLIGNADGSVERFGESAVRELDRQALALLEQQIASGPSSHAERVARVWPTIQANRALRNVLEGYDVLDPGVSCSGRLQRALVERSELRSLLMLSDGFYRLVDTYHRYTDASLFQAVERSGLRPLLEELRAIEAEDAECVRYPRFKRNDDASALWLQ